MAPPPPSTSDASVSSFDLAANPEDEKGRLQVLERYRVLDTPAERAFDHVAQVAAHLLDAPMAAVSLVDEDRQWCKAQVGLDDRECALEASFCARNIQSPGVLVVENAAEEGPFKDLPVVTDGGVRFYVGAPLETPGGYRIGTLCVLDTEARARPSEEKITHLKRLAQVVVDELELRRARRQAEQARAEAEEARAAEKQAREDAEAANRSKSRFLAGVAHDLRSPLSAINSLAEVLQRSLGGEEAEHAARIRRATRQLGAMADSLTDLARLRSGTIDFDLEPADLRPLVEDAAAALEMRASRAGIDLRVQLPDRPVAACVSPGALRRVIDNLVSNAIKYASGGDRVAVHLDHGSGKPADGHAGRGEVALTVADDGPGIDPEFLPNLFEPFSRAEAGGDGVGLGLAVAKELVEAMHGRIHVDSAPNEGTTARVVLQAAPESTEAGASEAGASEAGTDDVARRANAGSSRAP
jgi:signal transduction histidine kinase